MEAAKFEVHDNDLIEIHMNNEAFPAITGRQMKGIAPNWTGEFSLGDIVQTDLGEQRILELQVKYPDPPSVVTTYVVTIGNL